MVIKTSLQFTQGRVKSMACPHGKDYVVFRDEGKDAAPGLGVRVTKAGVQRYVFEKRVRAGKNSRSRRVTIGDVRNWKLDDARKEARRLAVLVDNRKDPRIEAAADRAQAELVRMESQRHGRVLEGVWQLYIEDRKATWGARHLRDHIRLAHKGGERKKKGGGKRLTTSGPLASLMPLKLSELTAGRIAPWLKLEAKKRPTSTAQAYRLLRAFVQWTHEYTLATDGADQYEYRGIIPADACRAQTVRDAVPKSRAKKDDCLQKQHLAAWFGAVRSLPNPVISAYLQILLLVGARREELATLRWEDVDTKWNSITIRDKVEGKRTIPLTPAVASLLSTLPRKNEWVFPSDTAKSGRLVSPTRAHNDALEAAGLTAHVSLHGLRRSFRTLSEWPGIHTGVIAQIMGHKPSAIAEKHYTERPIDFLRDKLTEYETWMLSEAGLVAPVKAAA